jgi:sulfur relay (sulfurtransferase) DsrF/TusC family protein
MVYKTYLFIPPHGTWEVSESLDTVMAMLKNSADTAV